MEDWKKRAAILIAIGLVFGVVLFAVKSVGIDGGDAPPAPEPSKISVEEKPAPSVSRTAEPSTSRPAESSASRPATRSTPAAKLPPPTITPTPPRPRQHRPAPPNATLRLSQEARDLYNIPGDSASQVAAFRALFRPAASGRVEQIDRGEVALAVDDYLGRHRSYLGLSPSDRESLTDLVTSYRESDLRLRSARRTGANTKVMMALMSEMKVSMEEFRKVTNPQPEDLFGAEASAPPPFGDETSAARQAEELRDFFENQASTP